MPGGFTKLKGYEVNAAVVECRGLNYKGMKLREQDTDARNRLAGDGVPWPQDLFLRVMGHGKHGRRMWTVDEYRVNGRVGG